MRKEQIRPDEYENFFLGSLVLCHDHIKRKSRLNVGGLMAEYIWCFCHGILHLCGYDHEVSEEEERVMRSLEQELMKCIQI